MNLLIKHTNTHIHMHVHVHTSIDFLALSTERA
jgi:hypothetical protein